MKKVLYTMDVEDTINTLDTMMSSVLTHAPDSDERFDFNHSKMIRIPEYYANFCENLINKPNIVLKEFQQQYELSNLNKKKFIDISFTKFIMYLCACNIALTMIHDNVNTLTGIFAGFEGNLNNYALVLISTVDGLHQIYQNYRVADVSSL